MTNLSSFSLINSKVEKIKIEESLQSPGIAFMKLCLAALLKLNEEEIEEALTDGPEDGELDAIYIENNIVHILTFKYTDQFDFTKKNYPGAELEQFALHVDMFIGGNLLKKSINKAVWEKYETVLDLAKRKRVEFRIYVVSNKLEPIDSAKNKLNAVIAKFRGVEAPHYVNQENLVNILLNEKSVKIDGKFNFIDKQYFEKSNGSLRTVIGVVSGTDLIELIKSDDETLKEEIFNENVRVYKSKHRINKEIIETAKSDNNFEFFYLNNGVTILCEDVHYTPNTRNPLVEIKNLQIINGGQTSHSLFEVFKTEPDKLHDVEVLVRICIVKKDNPISGKISETTNSQIPVGNRDLRSNDYVQRKLKNEFETLGYFYETKPNEYIDNPKSLVLNNELLAQVYMSYHMEMPSEAKNKKSIVFGENYDQIFDESVITAKELLRLHKIYSPIFYLKKEIQSKKRKKQNIEIESDFVSWATFHVVYGVKLLQDKSIAKINAQPNLKPKEMELAILNLLNEDPSKLINEVIEKISEIVIAQRAKLGNNFSYDKFFKESSTNSILKSYLE